MRAITHKRILSLVAGFLSLIIGVSAAIAGSCPQETSENLIPTSKEEKQHCKMLWDKVKDPSAYPLAEYEDNLNTFFINFCHRDKAAGWVRDKYVHNTGPGTAHLVGGEWAGKYFGTHAPVLIWYSPEMFEWIKKNRNEATEHNKKDKETIPDGAMLIKEMYASPAAKCAAVEPEKLLPTPNGAAIMIRDNEASHDGWFWGWYGFTGFANDYPANNNSNSLPNMGYGQYCMNCHASARDNLTFSSLKNIEGEPGIPLVFLSQDDDASPEPAANHPVAVLPGDQAPRLGQPLYAYNPDFTAAFPWPGDTPRPSYETVSKMPSQTYDNVFVEAGGPSAHSEYLTSDQCLGCHDAGSTGLQFDMTVPVTPAEQVKLPYADIASAQSGSNTKPTLWNHSPYATWGTSPMGLAGRDPIFFAQLASETQTFHKPVADVVENTCLGCHGFMGQRQFGIDQSAKDVASGTTDPRSCGTFTREMANAVPYPADNPTAKNANYGALARDGISCLSCHRMILGEKKTREYAGTPGNHCVIERQDFLNPSLKGFGRTFTGSFLVGPPDEIYGPFKKPLKEPTRHALGNTPKHNSTLAMSETCGTCHTVHLPVYFGGERVVHDKKKAS
ncbi:MAG: cytochrome P460 family protein, partial [Alphaproteobacteria bacterium]|nr:cytochrome P460 family protein [Alphaproteobacteria bacterium]